MAPADLLPLLRSAELAAREASVPVLAAFRSPALLRERKRDGTVVTAADRAAEDVARRRLRGDWPDIPVLGEERGADGEGDLVWIVDPIDGTISFSLGIPLFGTLIALVDGGTPLLGVVALPALGEVWSGGRGLGVRCNGEPWVWPSDDGSPERSLVAVGDPSQFVGSSVPGALAALQAAFPHTRAYTDAFGHALVLRGAVGAMLDPGLAAWDLAASSALIPELGGAWLARPSPRAGKWDVLFGRPGLVARIAAAIGWV